MMEITVLIGVLDREVVILITLKLVEIVILQALKPRVRANFILELTFYDYTMQCLHTE